MTEQRTDSMAVATPLSDADGLLTWERVFPRLPCPVQRQFLSRVSTPGGLTTNDLQEQLPTALPNRAKSCLDAVLSGQSDCLPNFEVPTQHRLETPIGDALYSPDIALLGILSSTNIVAQLVDIAQSIVESGRRLLVVTPTTQEANVFVDRWTTDSDQAIGFALHPKENSTLLSKNARSYTTTALLEHGWTTTRNEMQQRISELQTEQRLLQQARKRLPELHTEREQLAHCQANCTALDGNISTVAEHPHWNNHPLQTDLNSTLEALKQAYEEHQQASTLAHECLQKQASLHAEHEAHRSAGLMRKMLGLFRGQSDADNLTQVNAEHAETSAKLEHCQRTVTECETQRDTLQQRIHNEIRQQSLAECQQHEATIAAIHRELTSAGIEPTPSRSEDELTTTIDRRLTTLAEELLFAERWHTELNEQRDAIDRDGLKLLPVTVAPFSALGHDPLIPSRPHQPTHDTALILHAERLGSEEFERIALYARSWIMVGQPRIGERSQDRRGLFDILWQRLDVPLWRREAGQLVARIDPSNRMPSLSEPLADQPDIELRFTKDDHDELILAEVAFPNDWTLAQGKAFLAVELDEVRIETAGPASWSEDDAAFRVTWHDPGEDEPIRIELGSGISEEIVETGCRPLTVALHFDRDNWDRASTQAWIDEHRYCRRTVRLAADEHEFPALAIPSVRSLAGAVV